MLTFNKQYIESLTPMQKGRLEKCLKTKYNFSDVGVMTLKDFLESDHVAGVRQKVIPAVEYNRTKFNRMNNDQQVEYEKRLSETKDEYSVVLQSGSFILIPKIVYDSVVEKIEG